MASEEDHISVFNDDDDDDDGPLKGVVLDDDEEEDVPAAAHRFPDATGDSSDSDDTNSTSSAAVHLPSFSAVSIAVLPPSALAPINGSDPPPVTPAAPSSVAMAAPSSSSAAAAPPGERKPFDDSRKLFQKLWTDEDEIELLRGFLEYTTQRGPNWTGQHHDTTAFYDQIKSKIQLDCNKNQLVEKLRRLKKKYRTAVSRISSGKDSVFKSPHDQTIFDISRKIWANSIANRPEFDDDDRKPNPSGPPFVATPHSVADQRTPLGFGIDINTPDNRSMMMMNMGTPSRSRKRSRMTQVEEKSSRNVNFGVHEPVNTAALGQGSVEETVRSCLTPLLKGFIDKIAGRSGFDGSGSKGIGSLASNAIPMNFPAVSSGDVMDGRWRKQQILELEVYSKRLELVQDQIKSALEELRSRCEDEMRLF